MGYRRRTRLVMLAMALAVLASCTGSGEGTVAATSASPPDAPAVTSTTSPPERPAEPGLAVGNLHWESLNGPPGGRASFVAQDPYRPEHVYTISGTGLYQSANQGESWTQVAPGAVRDVSSVAFGPHGVYTCGRHGLLLVQPDGVETPLPQTCLTVAADDEWIYASNWSEPLAAPRVELWRASTTAELPVDESDWVEVTPPFEELAVLAGPPDALELSIDELLIAGDSLLATVALGHGGADINSVASQLYVSRDHGNSWQLVDVEIPEPLSEW